MTSDPRLGPVQRLDDGLARIEGVAAVAVLLAMVFVASAQALAFNLAEQGSDFARGILDGLEWADTFLQKGTLCLAFIGASMATHQDKHIAISVFGKLVSRRTSAMMSAFAALGSSVIAFILAGVFFQACLVADAAVPFEYELLISSGPAHICDVPAAELGDASRPAIFCALRGMLAGVGIPVSSGGGIAQLVAPLALIIIGLRLLARFVFYAVAISRGVFDEAAKPASSTEPKDEAEDDEPSSNSDKATAKDADADVDDSEDDDARSSDPATKRSATGETDESDEVDEADGESSSDADQPSSKRDKPTESD